MAYKCCWASLLASQKGDYWKKLHMRPDFSNFIIRARNYCIRNHELDQDWHFVNRCLGSVKWEKPLYNISSAGSCLGDRDICSCYCISSWYKRAAGRPCSQHNFSRTCDDTHGGHRKLQTGLNHARFANIFCHVKWKSFSSCFGLAIAVRDPQLIKMALNCSAHLLFGRDKLLVLSFSSSNLDGTLHLLGFLNGMLSDPDSIHSCWPDGNPNLSSNCAYHHHLKFSYLSCEPFFGKWW